METIPTNNVSVTAFFEVREYKDTGYKSMYATENLKPFTILSKFGNQEILEQPTRHTVQLKESQHIVLAPNYLQYINHSCDPNVYFDTQKMQLISLRAIKKGEEVVFFYPSTEWKMTEAFACSCKSERCLNTISGAAYLTPEQLTQYRLTEHIIQRHSKLTKIQS